jgi:hypothetical protein
MRKNWFPLPYRLSLVKLLLVIGIIGISAAPAAACYTIQGYVYDGTTNNPLSGVSLTIRVLYTYSDNTSEPDTIFPTTNANGFYTALSNPPTQGKTVVKVVATVIRAAKQGYRLNNAGSATWTGSNNNGAAVTMNLSSTIMTPE